MDKNKNRMIVFISAAVALMVAAFAAYLLTRGGADRQNSLEVYFFNAATGTLEPEEYYAEEEENALLERAVGLFFDLPRSAVLTRPWPEAEGFLQGYGMNGNILEAKVSTLYDTLTPVDETLFRTAFIKTMTGLPGVDYVRIIRERAPGGGRYLSSEDYLLNPVVSPNKITSRQFTLYFVNETMDGLVKRIHTSDQVDMDQEEMYIINQLIEGQTADGVYPTIPPETKVTVEMDESTSTCYVNLSSEIKQFSGTTPLAELMLYSIVNSLTENLVHVRRVQFQIDSQIEDQFYGVPNFNQVFEKNDALAAG